MTKDDIFMLNTYVMYVTMEIYRLTIYTDWIIIVSLVSF